MAKRASKEDIQNLFRKPSNEDIDRATGQKIGTTRKALESYAAAVKKVQKLAPHVVVDAKAGTGKTTTLIGGLHQMKGQYPGFQPSEQQKKIWECLSRGEKPETIAMVSFNKSIATELQKRVPMGVNASTMHSMGNNACMRHWKNLKAQGRRAVNGWKTQNLLEEITGTDIRELRKDNYEGVQAAQKLIGLSKSLLLGWDAELGFNVDAITDEMLEKLAMSYDVDFFDSEVCGWVRDVLDAGSRIEEMENPEIDFDDMIWLPVVRNIPMFRYDMLMVDESQDLNPCQQELAFKAGERLVFVGDPRQAIYAFTGADSNSIQNLTNRLRESDRGVEVFPLNVTYRCGKKIVERAQRLVPEFFACDKNPDGEIVDLNKQKLMDEGQDGDMVVCRVNAPLVGTAFKFISAGKKATIIGGDIGKSLIQLITKLKPEDVADLMDKVETWYMEECKKVNKSKYPNEAKLAALEDKKDCVLAFCEGCFTVELVKQAINKMFVDDTSTGIRLSSIHKAKGLEADRVFILHPELIPHPMARTPEAKDQEMNLMYVAQTRPKLLLGFVNG